MAEVVGPDVMKMIMEWKWALDQVDYSRRHDLLVKVAKKTFKAAANEMAGYDDIFQYFSHRMCPLTRQRVSVYRFRCFNRYGDLVSGPEFMKAVLDMEEHVLQMGIENYLKRKRREALTRRMVRPRN